MEARRQDQEKATLFGIFFVAGLVLAMLTASGCGLMGVRNVDFWGAKMEFSEGLDFHVGGNQIDRVDDRRGVTSGLAYKKGAVAKD